jgi:hypothetical protein
MLHATAPAAAAAAAAAAYTNTAVAYAAFGSTAVQIDDLSTVVLQFLEAAKQNFMQLIERWGALLCIYCSSAGMLLGSGQIGLGMAFTPLHCSRMLGVMRLAAVLAVFVLQVSTHVAGHACSGAYHQPYKSVRRAA